MKLAMRDVKDEKSGKWVRQFVEVGGMIYLEDDGVVYNIAKRPGTLGITIHVASGGQAISVYPQAANSITIKAADYV